MLKKTISYTDFNDNERTEEFYFNLSKAEIAEWELRENLSGGLHAVLERVVASNDGRKIMDAFREIISKAYGVKSDDGRSFQKSPEISSGFLGSEAYSVLFMELISDPDAAAKFINAIVPKDLAEGAAENATKEKKGKAKPQDHQVKAVTATEQLH